MKKFANFHKFNIIIYIIMPVLMILVLAGAYTGTLYSFGGMTSMEKIFVKKEKYKVKSGESITLDIEAANITILRSKTEKASVYLKAAESTPEEEQFSSVKKGKALQITDLSPADSGGVKLPFAKGSWNREFWIYLPEDFAGSLTITQKSGNFQTEIPLLLNSFTLNTGDGDVFITELEAAQIDIENANGGLVIEALSGAGSISGSGKLTVGIKSLTGDLELRSGKEVNTRLLLDPPYRLNADAKSRLRISKKIATVEKSQKQYSGDFGDNPVNSINLFSESKITVTD